MFIRRWASSAVESRRSAGPRMPVALGHCWRSRWSSIVWSSNYRPAVGSYRRSSTEQCRSRTMPSPRRRSNSRRNDRRNSTDPSYIPCLLRWRSTINPIGTRKRYTLRCTGRSWTFFWWSIRIIVVACSVISRHAYNSVV